MADGEHLNAAAREALELSPAARIDHIRRPRWIGYTRAKQLLDKLDDLLTHQTEEPETEQHEPAAELEAVFTLESAAVCPACKASMDSVGIVRLLRTRVNFVSTLPRRGQLMVCPECRTVLGGGLGGFV